MELKNQQPTFSTNRTPQEIHNIINQPIPQDLLSVDYNGNKYVGSAMTYAMLNTLFPFAWKSELLAKAIVDEATTKNKKGGTNIRITVSSTVRLSINPFGDKWLSYDDVGIHTAFAGVNNRDSVITLAEKGSVSRGITRCARQFGYGANLYDKNGKVQILKDTLEVSTIIETEPTDLRKVSVAEPQQTVAPQQPIVIEPQQLPQPVIESVVKGMTDLQVLFAFLDDTTKKTPIDTKLNFLGKQLPKSSVSLGVVTIHVDDMARFEKLVNTLRRTYKLSPYLDHKYVEFVLNSLSSNGVKINWEPKYDNGQIMVTEKDLQHGLGVLGEIRGASNVGG